jgi:hypothetical protein
MINGNPLQPAIMAQADPPLPAFTPENHAQARQQIAQPPGVGEETMAETEDQPPTGVENWSLVPMENRLNREIGEMGVLMTEAVRWVSYFQVWREGNEENLSTLKLQLAEFAGVLQRVAASLHQNMQHVSHLVGGFIHMQSILKIHQDKLLQSDSRNEIQEYKVNSIFPALENITAHVLQNWNQNQQDLKTVQDSAASAVEQTNQYLQQRLRIQDDKIANLELSIKNWTEQFTHTQQTITQERDTNLQSLWAILNAQRQEMASVKVDLDQNQSKREEGQREREALVAHGLREIQRQNDLNMMRPFRPPPIVVLESPPPGPPHPQ